MEKRHLKLIPIVLSASLFPLISCVDNDYDLTEDIDLTVQIGGSEFAIPGGETEPIRLSKILDIEEDGVVKTDEYGNYYLLQEGTEQTTDVSVDGFEIESPEIDPIRQEIHFTLPPLSGPGINEELPPVDLPEEKTSFDLTNTDLPAEIKGLSFIDMEMEAVIRFSFSPDDIADNLYLKDVNLSFPAFVQSPDLKQGVLHLKDKVVSNTNGLTVTIPINGIDCTQSGITFTVGSILIHGEISLNGSVTLNTKDIHGKEGDVTVALKADITLRDKQTKRPLVKINSITGEVEPDIEINIEPITLTGLPDFLDDDRVTLSVEKPMIFFIADNSTPISAKVNGTIMSYKDDVPLLASPVIFNFDPHTITKGNKETFCLLPPPQSPEKYPEKKDTTFIPVNKLEDLISKIPDLFDIQVTAEAIRDPQTNIDLNHTYTITTDYNVNVPFVFGDKVTQIVYKDSVDGWYDDLKDYEVKQVNATATAVNKIPLGLNFTAKALTVDAQGNAQELQGVTVTVKVDGEKDGIIKAGENNTAVESALVIEIKETTSGAVKKLDGLAFEIVAASGTNAKGQQLNENQTLQLTNVRLKVPGGAIVDFN